MGSFNNAQMSQTLLSPAKGHNVFQPEQSGTSSPFKKVDMRRKTMKPVLATKKGVRMSQEENSDLDAESSARSPVVAPVAIENYLPIY